MQLWSMMAPLSRFRRAIVSAALILLTTCTLADSF
jgi:hypothetical protein